MAYLICRATFGNGVRIGMIEACYSGSFIPKLAAPKRTIITSASKNQRAVIRRTSSFSLLFFGQIERNKTIQQAFRKAANGIWFSQKAPQVDADGDGRPNNSWDDRALGDRRIPANLMTASLPPAFVSQLAPIELEAGQAHHVFEVELSGIQTDRVFATIISPDLDLNQELSSWQQLDQYIEEKELQPKGQNRYQLGYDNFIYGGDYTVIFQAANQDGLADPIQTTVTVPAGARLTGDVNGDQVVNIFDLVIAAGQFGQVGKDLMGDVNGDGSVNIFDLVIVAGNFGQSAVTAAPAMVAKIRLSTDQKHHIANAVDQLESNLQRSSVEEMVLGVLKAILPDRLPTTTQLLANYPNPFNPETWIPFELAEDAAVTVIIYDVQGKRVRQLQLGLVTAGRYVTADQAAYWDGKSETGEVVASGTYFYQLQAGDYTETRKMVILK